MLSSVLDLMHCLIDRHTQNVTLVCIAIPRCVLLAPVFAFGNYKAEPTQMDGVREDIELARSLPRVPRRGAGKAL